VLKDQISGKREKPLIGYRKPDDAKDKERKNPCVAVMCDPLNCNFSHSLEAALTRSGLNCLRISYYRVKRIDRVNSSTSIMPIILMVSHLFDGSLSSAATPTTVCDHSRPFKISQSHQSLT
jgi:hypothetical protein